MSDKTGLTEFATGLAGLGFELVSTGGTAAALAAAGLAVRNVSEVTGFPEMMDGRVKTLHPRVHGGILARRDHPEDRVAMRAQGIEPIDVVVVNLYPFAETARRSASSVADIVEQIDIGGPSLVRAAAKNFAHVLVVVDPADYAAVLEALAAPVVPLERRLGLARQAFAHTARYDAMVAGVLEDVVVRGGALERSAPLGAIDWPDELSIGLRRVRGLRYGENPHQQAAWYADATESGFGVAEVLQGRELSYTNLLDLDAAWRIALEFTDEPVAIVVKHTNPCGVATGATPAEAYERARAADAQSAFGGIVGLNRRIDRDTATALVSTFIEAVLAPGVDLDARDVLARKPNMRVVQVGAAPAASRFGWESRAILGGMLVQERDVVTEGAVDWGATAERPEGLRVVTTRRPTPEEWRALRFAWRVAAHVKSNAVIFTDATATRAVGAGQMSRVDAVRVAMAKAGATLAGSVAASDAFFPFRDGLDAVAAAGATAVVQPGGSVRDQEVVEAANEHGLAMVFTGRRHFRH